MISNASANPSSFKIPILENKYNNEKSFGFSRLKRVTKDKLGELSQ